ncbi:hypothetical protein [Actinacidiphila soli]|uniref:hypothetical protein n=1 Tax=Actinacidiphila soli TaxID=2487275 RepID=UPI000FCB70E7|nr:hypothetical protein [Actinacidiphila soli]
MLLLFGLGAAVAALARIAIGGFAPAGHLPVLALTLYACGLIASLLSGGPPSCGATAGSPASGHRAAE